MGRGRRNKNKKPYLRQSRGNSKPSGDSRDDEKNGQGQWRIKSKEDMKNEAFEAYYKEQKIVPDAEWDTFMDSLKDSLPTTFRVNPMTGFHRLVKKMLRNSSELGFNGPVEVDGKTFDPPQPIPWYPDDMAWYFGLGRAELRRAKEITPFRKFLIQHDAQGNVNRQEAVSMIPPLLLDVKSHHIVLDMCAAPGSKTAQLITALHSDGAVHPTGLVIANDADPKRAYMLVHQLKRLGSPNFAVTVHDGQAFPKLWISESDGSAKPLQFDRILCDVPCTGDGTMRKNYTLWKDWKFHMGNGLHMIQLAIGLRALSLLKVGGYMVYSTCSFNHIENEAVLSELIRRGGGAVELVDATNKLPGLQSDPGMSSWKVYYDGVWYEKFEDVPEKCHRKIIPSMFPPPEGTVPLHHALRILPHRQNTGGFFIALLKKTREVAITEQVRAQPGLADASKHEGREPGTKADGNCDGSDDEAKEAGKRKRSPEGEGADEKTKVQKVSAGDDSKTAAADQSPPVIDADGVDQADADTSTVNTQELTHKNIPGQSDNYTALAVEDLNHIRTFYDLQNFPSQCLYGRSNQAKKVYYLAPATSAILACERNFKLKLVHTGLRVLEKCTAKDRCRYRVCQEGVYAMIPYLGKQRVTVSFESFMYLLENHMKDVESFPEDEQKQMNACEHGSLIVTLAAKDDAIVSLSTCALLSKNTLTLFVTKVEKAAYLAMLKSAYPVKHQAAVSSGK